VGICSGVEASALSYNYHSLLADVELGRREAALLCYKAGVLLLR
jgi:hypothetical protein